MSTWLDLTFRSLTGFSPMSWQRRLFERFVTNEVPISCDIPTGLGKTSVIPLWLLALVKQADEGDVRLPRRLVYIVNRRTVVDQATETVEQMRRRIAQPECCDWQGHATTLQMIAGTLRALCATDGLPLGVSTLRGELADNEEWKADPARPAIIVGTIDMIGSKLLFSGYGDKRYGRTHHAGLVGHDALIVHDEAHLTPSFSELLHAIAREQDREAKRADNHGFKTGRPVRVLELSATTRRRNGNAFTLEVEDQSDLTVHERLMAAKRLHLHIVRQDKAVEEIARLAKKYESARAKILIYVQSPDQAQQIAATLARSLGNDTESRIAILTGTIRGHERDLLVNTNPVYRALLESDSRVDRTVYLVSTSAGEVGIDLDADHLICDLTTLDGLIQRLGRVNRRGGRGREAEVHIVGDAPAKDGSAFDQAIAATLELLKDWDRASQKGIDVSPANLRHLLATASSEATATSFSPVPEMAPVTDILLDGWSLTTIHRMPGRPDLAPFLHGLTQDPPETLVVWRQEISLLSNAVVDDAMATDWLDVCPVQHRERLRDRTDRVKKGLESVLKSHRKRAENADFPLILLDERGRAQWARLSQVVEKDFKLAYRTVLLPVEARGLDRNGMLSGALAETMALDVAEVAADENHRERWLHRRSADGESYEHLITGESGDILPLNLRERSRITLKASEEGDIEAETLDLVLLVTPWRSVLDNPETTVARQTLVRHAQAITEQVTCIANRLGLPDSIRTTLIAAAQSHDRGKNRPVWQRYACNDDGHEPLAKSQRYLHPRALGGYRHEFGSLLETMLDGESDEDTDLMLHLVAAHHGWSRPHFEPRSYDNTRTSSENARAIEEAMRRFGRLQQRFGRWGLAWLESLLRCADIIASQQAVQAPPMQDKQAG